MNQDFISYAHQELSKKQIIKHARQYSEVNMAELLGADENKFPFLVEDVVTVVCFWDPYSGIVYSVDEDPVRDYATQEFLRENAYPVFESFEAAEKHALDRAWPRKT